jgi:hypothetical protein
MLFVTLTSIPLQTQTFPTVTPTITFSSNGLAVVNTPVVSRKPKLRFSGFSVILVVKRLGQIDPWSDLRLLIPLPELNSMKFYRCFLNIQESNSL